MAHDKLTGSGHRDGASPRQWHGSHHSFGYRPHAFRFIGHDIVGINFLPLATHMRGWLLRKDLLPVAGEDDRAAPGGYRNPYTYSGVALALAMANVVNDHYAFCQGESADTDPVVAAIERLRLHNELLLYAARICETTIKQLLYCTQLPERRYERLALGQLLDAPCPHCRKENGKEPHTVSLAASLAHPFGLCREFTHCALDHFALMNKLRNSHAAHSGMLPLEVLAVNASREAADREGRAVVEEFLHLLLHLEHVEQAMLDDLAEKGEALTLHRWNGLAPEDANFNLMPGRPVPEPVPAPR